MFSVDDFFWFRFARRSGMFFGAGLAFALAALILAGLRIDLFGGIRPAPFTSFQGFSRLWRRGAHHLLKGLRRRWWQDLVGRISLFLANLLTRCFLCKGLLMR